MPRRPPSLRDRLARDLADIEGQIQALLDISAIRYINPNRHDNSFVVIGAADYGWAPSDDQQQLARMKLTRDYDAWYARFRTLFGGITPERKKSIEEADRFAREWITRADTWDHSVPRTIAEAKVLATQSLAPLRDGLALLGSQGQGGIRLVPDTSALMNEPDLTAYSQAAGGRTFTIHVLPQVLVELDALKDGGRPEQQKRARAALRGIKDLKRRGELTKGVKLTRGITVVADPREPVFTRLPDWLNPQVPDDRVLAGALEVQAEHPSSVVILVASDINLQNKAEVVGLPAVELPEPAEKDS
jgi:PIN domain